MIHKFGKSEFESRQLGYRNFAGDDDNSEVHGLGMRKWVLGSSEFEILQLIIAGLYG